MTDKQLLKAPLYTLTPAQREKRKKLQNAARQSSFRAKNASTHQYKAKQAEYKKKHSRKSVTSSSDTKCDEPLLTKREYNRVKMQIYRQEVMTVEQKNKVKEYDRKRAAKRRLMKKTADEDKKEAAKRRKQESRWKQEFPTEVKKFEKLVDKLVKFAKTSPTKTKIVETSVTVHLNLDVKRRHLSVLQLSCFRRQNRVRDHTILVEKFKSYYGSLRKAAKAMKMDRSSFLELCKPLEEKKPKVRENWLDIKTFYQREEISQELPTARAKERRYMTKTIEESYSLYRGHCLKLGRRPVSLSTFRRMRPKDVYKLHQTPDRQCICEVCENFRLLRLAFANNKIQGIESHTSTCIRQSMCTVTDEDSNASNADPFHQVDPSYGYLDCINRSCRKCGTDLVLMSILEKNTNIEECEDIVKWQRWEWVLQPVKPKKTKSKSKKKKDKKPTKKLTLVDKNGTKKDLINAYIEDLKPMAFHSFSCNWNYSQFQYCRDNLKPGQLLQVLDFGQNYLNVFQDQPQSVHWDHDQTVIHPIVNYYLDEQGKRVTEEHIIISDDLKHDKFAVKAFEKATLDHLKEKGFVPKQIIQFCDNCAGQYKSYGPFQFISAAGIPTIRLYFGARHGKGPADGVVGRIKAAVRMAVKGRQVVIRTAKEFYEYTKLKFSKNRFKAELGQTFLQEFFFVDDIDRSEKMLAKTAPGTRSFYSIRSTGKPLVIEAREVPCCCDSCLDGNGEECPNQAYSSGWKAISLRTGKAVMDDKFVNTHWSSRTSNATKQKSNMKTKKSKVASEKPATVPRANESVTESSDESDEEHDGSEINWNDIYREVMECSDYSELEEYVLDLYSTHRDKFRSLIKPIQMAPRNCNVDRVAEFSKPKDCPTNLLPLVTKPDGNCCARAISTAIFGHQNKHLEIRLRIMIEGVVNKRRYLDHDYLSLGSKPTQRRGTFPQQYALFSGQYIPTYVNFDDVVETIYEREMFEIREKACYMGMWQLWAASNIIGRPITSVFPERGSESFRFDFNRLIVPFDVRKRKKLPLNIMWTPMVPFGDIVHFVPLLLPRCKIYLMENSQIELFVRYLLSYSVGNFLLHKIVHINITMF